MQPHTLVVEELKRNASSKFVYFDFETFIKEDHTLTPNQAVMQHELGGERMFLWKDHPLGTGVTSDLCEPLSGRNTRETTYLPIFRG